MSDKETYHEGICRLLRGMTGKTEMSFGRSSIASEWTLCVNIADAPAWFLGNNWMLPRHAAAEIERLRKEAFSLAANQCHAGYGGEYGHHRCREIDRITAERDEATRLLHAMVEHIYEITPTDKNPKHTCDFDHRPERGACKFCENWTAANVLLYGKEYVEENA